MTQAKPLHILALVLAVSAQAAWPRPTIPESQVPHEAPQEVRRQIRRLYSRSAEERGYAAVALGEMREQAAPAVPFLVAMLGDSFPLRVEERVPEAPAGTREHIIYRFERMERTSPGKLAAESLARIGQRAAEPLIEVLSDENEKVRQHAALALGGIKAAEAVPGLIPLLEDEVGEVRAEAAKALGRIGDRRAVEALIQALGDPSSAVRKEAAWALGEIKDPRAVDALIERLGDSMPHVSEVAEWALDQIRDPRAYDAVLAKLSSESPEARRAAARILGKLRDRRAVPHLIDALDDVAEVQIEALHALEKFSGIRAEEYGPDPDKWRRWWKLDQARRTVRKLEEEGDVEALLEALRDENWALRASAAQALGRLNDPRAVEPLVALLTVKWDRDSAVRLEAVWALGLLRDPRAVEPLIATLKDDVDPRVREEADDALRAITGQDFSRNSPREWQDWWAEHKEQWLARSREEAQALAAQERQAEEQAAGREAEGGGVPDWVLIVLGIVVVLPVLGLIVVRAAHRPKPRKKGTNAS
ncbi:MAG: HEAT repeat domain-containing protein [Candidatus Brocadiia bacterium]